MLTQTATPNAASSQAHPGAAFTFARVVFVLWTGDMVRASTDRNAPCQFQLAVGGLVVTT